MAIRTDFTAGEVLAAADLNDTFAAKLNLAGGKILQVVSVFKADVFTTSSATLVDVTGLSVSITPSSATSKILVLASLPLSNSTADNASQGAILRGATVIGGGTAAGNRPSLSFWNRSGTTNGNNFAPMTMTFIDSPASTSALTYKIQIAGESGTTAVGYAYRADNDSAAGGRLASSIILMEVSA
jgi:hypothetical protein